MVLLGYQKLCCHYDAPFRLIPAVSFLEAHTYAISLFFFAPILLGYQEGFNRRETKVSFDPRFSPIFLLG